MPTKILMPALSPTMEHGNLAKWLKKEGDTIKAGEVIAEIETDKATMEVEAVDEGILAKILIPQGAQEVPVNTLIAILIEDNENESVLAEFIAKEASANSVAAEDNSDKKQLLPAVLNNTHNSQPMQTPLATSSGRVFASPLARRVAAIDGVSLANIRGSGPHGRISFVTQ